MSNILQLITDHIDIWTAADIAKKSGPGRNSGNASSVYGINKLRELLLELAVRGKLVPQNPKDESSSELIKRIYLEKTKLIKNGTLKKQKIQEIITQDEKPFEIPISWEWLRLDDISPMSLVDGDWIESKDQDPSGDIRLVQLADVGVGEFKDKSDRFINQETFKRLNCTQLQAGDILIARLPSPIGRACLFPAIDQKAITVVDVAILRPLGMFCDRYIVDAINSKTFREQVESFGKGATRFRIATGNLKSLLIPIPPLKEQHRIVAKVEELMALCDQLEVQHTSATEAHEKLVSHLLGTLTQSQNAKDFNENWQRIATHFDILFTTESSIVALEQTILQLAVMGKLTQQNPNDEPADKLIQNILTKRDNKIETERMRTTASENINESEKYIQIPKNWSYCRLGNLAKFIDYRGKTPKKVSSGIPLITAKNVRFGYISREPYEYVTENEYKTWMTRGFPHVGDMLFTTEAPLGNIAIIDIDENFALAQRVICFQLHDRTIAPFMKIAIMSNQFQNQLTTASTGMTATGIKASKLKEIPVPIPPLAEQHRIVAKLDALMALCGKIKSRISEASQLQKKIADVIVSHAVL